MSNPLNDFNKRSKRPQTIASAMGDLMRMFGIRASDADLIKRWDKIMGSEISAIANVVAIKKAKNGKFNITLRPKNPAFTLQLSYMSDEIKKKINNYFGREAVEKISFRK